MKKKKTKQDITNEDIQRALEKFNKAGGLIKTLPAQYVPSRVMTAGKGIYEKVEKFPAKVDHAG